MDAIPITPPTIQCVSQVSEKVDIPLLVLLSIQEQEGGRAGLEVRNKNGTYDLGVMQINTVWLPFFSELGITREQLKNNGCMNVAASAVILKQHLDRSHGDIWKAVGMYHSKTPFRSIKYSQNVKFHMNSIIKKINQLSYSMSP